MRIAKALDTWNHDLSEAIGFEADWGAELYQLADHEYATKNDHRKFKRYQRKNKRREHLFVAAEKLFSLVFRVTYIDLVRPLTPIQKRRLLPKVECEYTGPFVCEECGDEYYWHYTSECKGRCFTCQFWYDRWITHLTDPNSIVVDGTAYIIGEEQEKPGWGSGFGGSKFTISYFDARPNRVTRNLWCQGDVPGRYRYRMPDDAEFLCDPPASPIDCPF